MNKVTVFNTEEYEVFGTPVMGILRYYMYILRPRSQDKEIQHRFSSSFLNIYSIYFFYDETKSLKEVDYNNLVKQTLEKKAEQLRKENRL